MNTRFDHSAQVQVLGDHQSEVLVLFDRADFLALQQPLLSCCSDSSLQLFFPLRGELHHSALALTNGHLPRVCPLGDLRHQGPELQLTRRKEAHIIGIEQTVDLRPPPVWSTWRFWQNVVDEQGKQNWAQRASLTQAALERELSRVHAVYPHLHRGMTVQSLDEVIDPARNAVRTQLMQQCLMGDSVVGLLKVDEAGIRPLLVFLLFTFTHRLHQSVE